MSNKLKILLVAHNSVHSTSFGGVEAYLNTLSKYISTDYEVYLYVPGLGEDQKCIYLYGPDGTLLQKIAFDSAFTNWQLSCQEREAAFAKVLNELGIALVHFHHLAGHPPSLVNIAKENDVRTIFTFHDFYGICHVSNLINFEGRYCQPDTLAPADCDTCLNKKYSIEPGSQQIRRKYWNNLFAAVDGLIFNTQGGFEIAAKIYPNVANHLNVAILPVAIEPIEIPKGLARKSDEIRVAILGHFVHHKGADVVVQAVEQLAGENISFHFFGEIDAIYEEKLNLSKNTQIFRYGKYPSGKLPRELFSCDVSLHVSICPETYSLALSEAWAAGLIPIVSDIGAFGERVVDGVNGLIVDAGSSTMLMDAILRIKADRKLAKIPAAPGLSPSPSISWMDKHANQVRVFYTKIHNLMIKENIHPNRDSTNSDENCLVWATFGNLASKEVSRIGRYLNKAKKHLSKAKNTFTPI
jgi:glycosyltransferase involved in cell wall biosynthesis